MSLFIFVDALPYTFVNEAAKSYFENASVHALHPNVGYSSNLHWKLFENKMPDDIGFFTDWTYEKEPNTSTCLVAKMCQSLDCTEKLGIFSRKVLNRIPLLKHQFANIPYKYRALFSNKSQYLLSKSSLLSTNSDYEGYKFILQDELKEPVEIILQKVNQYVKMGEKQLFVSISEVDQIGHQLGRGKDYDDKLTGIIELLVDTIKMYKDKNPESGVAVVSDHGMLNASKMIEFKELQLPSYRDVIYAFDSEILKIYCNENSREEIIEILEKSSYGHLISEDERRKYGITDRRFGDLIFNLFESISFGNNWFAGSLKKSSKIFGMHGYWPNNVVSDHYGTLILYGVENNLPEIVDYNMSADMIKYCIKER